MKRVLATLEHMGEVFAVSLIERKAWPGKEFVLKHKGACCSSLPAGMPLEEALALWRSAFDKGFSNKSEFVKALVTLHQRRPPVR